MSYLLIIQPFIYLQQTYLPLSSRQLLHSPVEATQFSFFLQLFLQTIVCNIIFLLDIFILPDYPFIFITNHIQNMILRHCIKVIFQTRCNANRGTGFP